MTKIEEIQKAIAELSPGDLAKLHAWLEEFREESWDRQIEADAKTGKLDKLVEEARADLKAGRIRDL